MENYTDKVFCIDNLELMKKIPDNSVDLIYCDILYGTGRDFGDYKDIKANKEEVKEFYTPRIKELYRILKNKGTLALQMDNNINHWIRCILDDIFGYDGFKDNIIWDKGFRGTEKKKGFQQSYENILIYSKNKDYKWNDVYGDYSKSSLKRYNKVDENGKKYALIKRKRTDGSVYYGKSYLNTKGKKMDNVIRNIKTMASTDRERVDYPTQKPKQLIKILVEAYTDKKDIVADFFCGSGTTPVVAKELDRKYIACDISEKAVEITKKRLKKVK